MNVVFDEDGRCKCEVTAKLGSNLETIIMQHFEWLKTKGITKTEIRAVSEYLQSCVNCAALSELL